MKVPSSISNIVLIEDIEKSTVSIYYIVCFFLFGADFEQRISLTILDYFLLVILDHWMNHAGPGNCLPGRK